MRVPRLLSHAAPLVVAALVSSAPALADREGYSYVSYAGSDVSLVSHGEDDTNARVNTPVMAGDHMSTGGGRAEIVLADGNVVRVDLKSDLRFERLAKTYESEDDRDLLVLEHGSIAVESRYAAAREQAIRVDTDDATIVLTEHGLYRIDTGRRGTEVYVQSGKAEVNGRSGHAVVQAGQYAFITGSNEIEVDQADLPRDRFTRFVEERRDHGRDRARPAYAAAAGGTRYVSADYDYDYDQAGFDDYGDWTYVESYNRYCWRPRVSAGWAPYTQGYWRWSPCGLTWVSYEPWGWMPYHYGTWSFLASWGWCWLPGAAYSPAWVYWSYSPSYIGWCPMGYYGCYYDTYFRSNRAWYGSETNFRYPNLNGRVELARLDPRGWSYAPTTRIGARFDATRDIVRGDRITFRTGETALIATTPLRIDRRGDSSATGAIQEAVRRVPISGGPSLGGARETSNEGLTAILRRENKLSPVAQDELRRSMVRAGSDPAYKPVSPEGQTGERRFDSSAAGRTGPRVGAADPGRPTTGLSEVQRHSDGGTSWRESTGATKGGRDLGGVVRREDSGREAPSSRSDESWRSQGRLEKGPADRPVLREDGSRGSTGRRDDTGWRNSGTTDKGTVERPVRRDDSGWRSPATDGRPVEKGAEDRPSRRDDSGWRNPSGGTRESAPPRSNDPPQRDTAPPPRSYEAPHRDTAPPPAPKSSDAPHREAPSRSYEPPQRSYEPPQRSYEPSRRSYEAPRSYEPPRQAAPPSAPPRSYEAPHAAPAPAPPRSEASKG